MGCKKRAYYEAEALGDTAKNLKVVQGKKGVRRKKCINYYPGGSLQPGRSFSSPSYRYGFNGMEKDDEVKGISGASINFKYRMHDPRLGRFFAVDPLTSRYPYNSPYAFSENNVIGAVEIEGLEKEWLYDQQNLGSEMAAEIQKADAVIAEQAANAIIHLPEATIDGVVYTSSSFVSAMHSGGKAAYTEMTGNWTSDYRLPALGYTYGNGISTEEAELNSVSWENGQRMIEGTATIVTLPLAIAEGKEIFKSLAKKPIKSLDDIVVRYTLPDGNDANHVFSGRPGKYTDTPENRSLLESVANDSFDFQN